MKSSKLSIPLYSKNKFIFASYAFLVPFEVIVFKNLSKKYDISFDDLGKSKKTDTYSVAEEKEENADTKKPTPITNSAATPTPAFEKMVSDAEKHEENQDFKHAA